MKKPRLLSLVLILIALPIAGIASVLALNYSGFCVSEFRYLSDDEKIRNVVSGLAKGGVSRVFAERGGKTVEVGTITTLPYENIEQFFAANPDCCQVGPIVREGYYEPTPARRLTGIVSDIVAVRYLRRTVDAGGAVSTENVLVQFSMSACGRVVANVPF
jgi:hypothetical protein